MLETEADETTKSKPHKKTHLSTSSLKYKVILQLYAFLQKSSGKKASSPLPGPQGGGAGSEGNLGKGFTCDFSVSHDIKRYSFKRNRPLVTHQARDVTEWKINEL